MRDDSPSKAGVSFRPSKALGQHFLAHPGVSHRIISRSGLEGSDMVLEIGPGQGALTLLLARSVGHVFAVEKDPRLVRFIEEKLSKSGVKNVTLVNDDILKFDLREIDLPTSGKINVIGNLPYNISSPLLEKLVQNRNLLRRAVIMLQTELAERLTALPGCKAYAALTLWIRYHARTDVLLEVPKEAFWPRPKVNSKVLALDFEHPFARRAEDEAQFKRLLKGAFAHRRKTLANSLSIFFPSWDRGIILEALRKCRIDPRRRAETLDMDEFLNLASDLRLTV